MLKKHKKMLKGGISSLVHLTIGLAHLGNGSDFMVFYIRQNVRVHNKIDIEFPLFFFIYSIPFHFLAFFKNTFL